MGSLTLAKDGNVLYSRSFGYSQINGNEKKPLTAETKYRIASITKMFTAVMIFQLVEEGKLKLTDTLDKFFPQIPNAARITIGQILAHRSGIHNLEPDGSWGKQPRTKDEVVARIAQGQPDFEPDARHLYSNAGYILLGYIVEKVGGKPYQEALKERITSKIGLKDTYLGVGNTDPGKNEALSYRYIGGWKEAAELDFSITGGAGAILSTPTDMTKFIQALFDLKLVSQNSLKQMTTMRDGEGMGMEPFSFAGKTLYGHTGGSGSSGAWLAYFPEEKLALAYTTNAKIYAVQQYRERRFRHLLESAVSDPRLRRVRRQPGSSGPIRRRLHDPRNSRENDGYPRWSDALHSSRGRAIRCPARSNRRGQIQDRSWSRLRIRRRERPADDQTTQWGKGFHEGKITITQIRDRSCACPGVRHRR